MVRLMLAFVAANTLNLCGAAAHQSYKKKPILKNSPKIEFENVLIQKGADCGYHALYNGIAEYVWLTKGVDMGPLPTNVLAAWKKAAGNFKGFGSAGTE